MLSARLCSVTLWEQPMRRRIRCGPPPQESLVPDLTAESLMRDIKARIATIDKELAGYDTLRAEREQLVRAHDALDAPKPTGTERRRRAPRTGRSKSRRRAPRGHNREAILKAVKERPGASTGEIIRASGVEKRTAYTTITKLTKDGSLTRVNGGLEPGRT
jgi:DNA-binding transcriptional ArsR family regulator